jgi:hypothetical protein
VVVVAVEAWLKLRKLEVALDGGSCGRKRLELDERQIHALAEIQCTMIEIASVMGCSVDTLERRFADVIKNGRESGKSSLRRMQFKKAMEGNPTMLIWLGKHYLGQKEEVRLSTNEPEVRRLLAMWETAKMS